MSAIFIVVLCSFSAVLFFSLLCFAGWNFVLLLRMQFNFMVCYFCCVCLLNFFLLCIGPFTLSMHLAEVSVLPANGKLDLRRF